MKRTFKRVFMKALIAIVTITLIISIFVITSSAQCLPEPVCTQLVTFPGTNVSNISLNGDVCFEGYGDINNNNNFNNWNFQKYNSTDGPIQQNQNINFPNGAGKVYAQGLNVTFTGNFHMNGSDTFVIRQNSFAYIHNLISNNGTPSHRNVIIIEQGGILYYGSNAVEYNPVGLPDTIQTTLGNPSNDVIVITCNVPGAPLSLNNIVEFKIQGDMLYWFVEDPEDIQIQYSEESTKGFRTIHYGTDNGGSIIIKESGFYRIKSGNSYSIILPYNMKRLTPESREYLYYDVRSGKFSNVKPDYYIHGVKKIR